MFKIGFHGVKFYWRSVVEICSIPVTAHFWNTQLQDCCSFCSTVTLMGKLFYHSLEWGYQLKVSSINRILRQHCLSELGQKWNKESSAVFVLLIDRVVFFHKHELQWGLAQRSLYEIAVEMCWFSFFLVLGWFSGKNWNSRNAMY